MDDENSESFPDLRTLLIDTTNSLQSYLNEDNGKKPRKPKKNFSTGRLKVDYPKPSSLKSGSSHGFPKRYIFTMLGFVGMANVYALRVNLSVAILAMVDNSIDESYNESSGIVECPELAKNLSFSLLKPTNAPRYHWTEETVNRILGSFFYGYVQTQVPGGYLAEHISGKWLFGGGIFITALLTALTPLAVSYGVNILMANRILEGFAEGVTKPAMNSMVSRWSPKFERSRVSSFIFSGGLVGTAFTLPISGWLSSSWMFGGWPSVFYLSALVSIVWFLFWMQLVYDSPLEHPSISEGEQIYLEENQEIIHKSPKVPWTAICMSLPMWAVIVSHFGSSLGFLTLFTALPMYFKTVLHFDLQKDGNLSALPFLSQAIGAWIAAYAADKLSEAEILSLTTIRKIFNTIGQIGPAITLFLVTLCGCRPQLIVALVCLSMALQGFCFSGYQVTHIDMSPDFAGVLFGISSSIAELNGIFGPALVTAFTYNETTTGNWNKVFYVLSLGYTAGAVFYLLFASAELQPWGLDKKAVSIKESVLSNDIDSSSTAKKKSFFS